MGAGCKQAGWWTDSCSFLSFQCAATAPVTMGHGPQSFSDPRGKPPPYSRPDDLQSKRASPPPVYAQVIAHRDVYGN